MLIADNFASNLGGGLYVGDNTRVNVFGSSLISNRVDSFSNGGAGYVTSGSANILFIDSAIAYNDCGDGCPDDIVQGVIGAIDTVNSIYNATEETNGQGSAFTDASNLFGTSPNFENGYYLVQDDPLVTSGGSVDISVLPEYLARLPLATTASDGSADSGRIDIGYHHSSASATDVSGTEINPLNFQSTSVAVDSSITVEPKDSNGRKLGATAQVTMDFSSVFFNDSTLKYIGDGKFQVLFTMPVEDNCSNPDTEALNIYVNGTAVGVVNFSYWTMGC
jgi:hypothetical protein